VVPGGPADKVWIRPGDYVFEVEGKALGADVDVSRLLAGKAGQAVSVRVGPTTARDESRVLQVPAADWGALRGQEYRNWKGDREEQVKKAGGKIGYVHLRGMMDPDLDQFKKAVAGPLEGTEGLVLDVRNNGGGHIHQDLLDILTRRPFGAFHPRGGKKTLQPALYYTKPVVVLINERSFSDAEVFPYGFKALKRGIVVGVPTSGGVIGTGSTTLINGATLRMPSVGWYTLEGKNLEGLGVQPDVLVRETPEDRLAGRDPQLERALGILKEEIAKSKAAEGGRPEEKVEPKGKENTKEEGF
jgi:tricorn protease